MRIAYFSPLNPIKSGVSDYSEELLEYLAGFGRIELFIDDYRPSSSWLYDYSRFITTAGYSRITARTTTTSISTIWAITTTIRMSIRFASSAPA